MSRARTQFDQARAARLWAEGRPAAEIAASLGIPEGTFRHAMRRDAERFPPRAGRPSPVPDVEAAKTKVAAMLAKGETITAAGRAAGVSRTTVNHWIAAEPQRFARSPDALRRAKRTGDDARRASRAIVRAAQKQRRHKVPAKVDPNELVGDADGAQPCDGDDQAAILDVSASAPQAAATGRARADGGGGAGQDADPRPIGAAVFRPLPGTTPARLWDAKPAGCRWPVHVDGSDPLKTTTTFVCDEPRSDGKLPYCTVHRAIHGGSGSTGKRVAHRTLLAAA